MYNPLVSVIIPMYNVEEFITSTINSALNQTWRNLEVIVIDDGSTDKSYSLVKSIQDKRIKIFQQKNLGAPSARNHGLKIAQGDFIQYLDGDDLISLDKIEQQLLLLKDAPNHLSVCSTVHFSDDSIIANLHPDPYEDSFLSTTNNPSEFLINLWGGNTTYGSMVSIHAWLTPVNLIKCAGNWNEILTYDDDGEYFSRIVLKSDGIIRSKKGYSFYRKQSKNTVSDIDSKVKINSMLIAAVSKKNSLLKENNHYEAKIAAYKLIMDVAVKSFPKFLDLYRIAKKELPIISIENYQPSIGGPKIQKLANIFGWKIARLLQFIKKRK